MSKIVINGVKIMITSQKNPVITEQITLYPKLSCGGMSAYKLNNWFEQAVSKSHNKYDILDLKIDNPNKFKNSYNLKMASNQHIAIM